MFEKASDAVKKCIVFSLFLREKSMHNRAKRLKNGFAHKNRQKSTFGMSLFSKNRFLVDFWCPSGSPGASRDVPGAYQNRSFFQQF